MPRTHLNEVELMVLLAVVRLAPVAYGVPIASEIETRSERRFALATVYAVLERLESAHLVTSTLGEATPERGGRARRYFNITEEGLTAIRDFHKALKAMSSGLKELKGAAI